MMIFIVSMREILFLFDADSNSGLGHYSRIRAYSFYFEKYKKKIKTNLIGLVEKKACVHPIIPKNIRIKTHDEVKYIFDCNHEYVVFLDSYNQIFCKYFYEIKNELRCIKKLVSFCDDGRLSIIKNSDIIIDSTYSVQGECKEIVSGVDAVVLNPECYLNDVCRYDELKNETVFLLGNSPLSAKFLAAGDWGALFPNKVDTYPGHDFSYYKFESCKSEINIGSITKYADTIVVSAGQSLWEASLNKDMIYVVPLNKDQYDILKRLLINNLFKIIKRFKHNNYDIFLLSVELKTKRSLSRNFEKIKYLFKVLGFL